MSFGGYRPIKGLELFPPTGTQNPARLLVRGANTTTPGGRAALFTAASAAQEFYVKAATQFSLSVVAFTRFTTTLPNGDRVAVTFNGPDTFVYLDVAPRAVIAESLPAIPMGAVYAVKPVRADGSEPFADAFNWFIYPAGSARGAKWMSTGEPPEGFNNIIGDHGGVVGVGNIDAISWDFTDKIYSKGRQIGSVVAAIGDPGGSHPNNSAKILGGLVGNGRALIVTGLGFRVGGDGYTVLSFDLEPEPGVVNQNLRVEAIVRDKIPSGYPDGESQQLHSDPRGISVSPDKRRLVLVLDADVVDILMAAPGEFTDASDMFTVTTMPQPYGGIRETTTTYGGTKTIGPTHSQEDIAAGDTTPTTVIGSGSSSIPSFYIEQYAYPEWVYPTNPEEPLGHSFEWIMLVVSDTGGSWSSSVDAGWVELPFNDADAYFGGWSASGFSRIFEVHLRFPDGEELLVHRIDDTVPASETTFNSDGTTNSDYTFPDTVEYKAFVGAGIAHGHRVVYREETTAATSNTVIAGLPLATETISVTGNVTGEPSKTITWYADQWYPYNSRLTFFTNRYADQGELGRSMLYSHGHELGGIFPADETPPSGILGPDDRFIQENVEGDTPVYTGAWDTASGSVNLISLMQEGASDDYPDPGFSGLGGGWFFQYIIPW